MTWVDLEGNRGVMNPSSNIISGYRLKFSLEILVHVLTPSRSNWTLVQLLLEGGLYSPKTVKYVDDLNRKKTIRTPLTGSVHGRITRS